MELIKVSAEYLADQGVDNARLNAELLLGHVLEMDRLRLYLEHDRPIVSVELESYRELIRRRGKRVPLQLLLGHVQILDHEFLVREGVFIPRTETETLILEAQRLEVGTAPRILEVGVGTGCVGLSLLKDWPQAQLTGYDINPGAIELTAENTRLLKLDSRVTLREGSPFEDASLDEDNFDLVVSNPPYVLRRDLDELEPEVRDHDPREALDGGEDGLDVVRRLSHLARCVLRPGGWIAFEHGYDQGESAPALLRDAGWRQVRLVDDLGGRPRVSVGQRG
jgi:release factor glutamine methyltransferase